MGPRLFFLACALVLLVAQAVFGRTVQIGSAAPDLYLLFVVYLVSVLRPSRALLAAWALGLVRDCWTPAPLGVDACALLAAAGLLVVAHRRFVLDTDVALALLAFLAGLVHGAVWAAAVSVSGTGTEFLVLYGRIALPVALYSAVLMPLFARMMTAGLRRVSGGRDLRLA